MVHYLVTPANQGYQAEQVGSTHIFVGPVGKGKLLSNPLVWQTPKGQK
jgi:hypothetical protein